MTHITTGVEYGLHCLLYLVDDQGSTVSATARDLADLQGLPADYVAKLFTKLQKAGLLTSTEGVHGGYRLARQPNEISVHDVIVAIDGEKSLFECREIRGRCAVFNGTPAAWAMQGVCSIHAIMMEAEDRMREVLASHTLADLAATVGAKAAPEFAGDLARWLAQRAPVRSKAKASLAMRNRKAKPLE